MVDEVERRRAVWSALVIPERALPPPPKPHPLFSASPTPVGTEARWVEAVANALLPEVCPQRAASVADVTRLAAAVQAHVDELRTLGHLRDDFPLPLLARRPGTSVIEITFAPRFPSRYPR